MNFSTATNIDIPFTGKILSVLYSSEKLINRLT